MNKQISQMNEINARANQQRVANQRNAEISARSAKTAADTVARAREQHRKTVNNALQAKRHTGENSGSGGGKFVLVFIVISAILFALFVLIVSGLK
jgi:Flp pilus assembly protein TadB